MNAPGSRPRGFGPPASFGRTPPEDVVEKPDGPKTVEVPGGLKVVDGRLVVEVATRLLLPDEALQDLYDHVRDVVAIAVADGFAAAAGRPAREVDEVVSTRPVCAFCGHAGLVTSAADAGEDWVDPDSVVCTDREACLVRQGENRAKVRVEQEGGVPG